MSDEHSKENSSKEIFVQEIVSMNEISKRRTWGRLFIFIAFIAALMVTISEIGLNGGSGGFGDSAKAYIAIKAISIPFGLLFGSFGLTLLHSSHVLSMLKTLKNTP